jgi:cytochrome c oxidase subunit 2
MRCRTSAGAAAVLATAGLAGGAHASALAPAGTEAEAVHRLFLVMAGGGAAIWLAVVALLLWARRRRDRPLPPERAGQFILWGGAVVPTVILALLLVWGIGLMPALRAAPAEGEGWRIDVEARQFWWRVTYHRPDGEPVPSANELRLPVGEPVQLRLVSADMIHSLWIPALAGKMDMIPGRTNFLTLTATKPGRYRGVCAEFCGASHALMGFEAVALPPAAFRAWLAAEARPATPDPTGLSRFMTAGCAACHAIRGSAATAALGPDLTHVGGRLGLAAGALPPGEAALARFVAHAGAVKPGAAMPPFAHLGADDIAGLARFLGDLK